MGGEKYEVKATGIIFFLCLNSKIEIVAVWSEI